MLGDRFRKLSTFQVMHHYACHRFMLFTWNFSLLRSFFKGFAIIVMVISYTLNSVVTPLIDYIICIFCVMCILGIEDVKVNQENRSPRMHVALRGFKYRGGTWAIDKKFSRKIYRSM